MPAKKKYTKRQREIMRLKRRRKKKIFIIEMIVLAVLAVVLVGAAWMARKMSLINHRELDQEKVITAAEANQQYREEPAEISESATEDEEIEPLLAESAEQEAVVADLTGKDIFALVGLDSRYDVEQENSDTMIICYIDHDAKTIDLVSVYRDTYLNIGRGSKGGSNSYEKANAAYNVGGPEQMLTMLNLNMDLNIEEYISVEFKALAETIELLGGIDLELSRVEVELINNKYLNNTANACGMESSKLDLPPEEEFSETDYRNYHLDGVQAVCYARIRHTAGNDFRRTARQRLVLSLVFDKAKQADISTLNKILEKVLPLVETNLSNRKILSLVRPLLTYEIEDSVGFPFDHIEDPDQKRTGYDCVIPVTLENNVRQLHEYLFGDDGYTPSRTVKNYSYTISMQTGLGSGSIPSTSEDGSIPWLAEGEGTLSAQTLTPEEIEEIGRQAGTQQSGQKTEDVDTSMIPVIGDMGKSN